MIITTTTTIPPIETAAAAYDDNRYLDAAIAALAQHGLREAVESIPPRHLNPYWEIWEAAPSLITDLITDLTAPLQYDPLQRLIDLIDIGLSRMQLRLVKAAICDALDLTPEDDNNGKK